MIKNSVSFWFWWTRALREWFEDKFSHIVFDKSDLAKQGADSTVTLTGVNTGIDEVKQAIQDIDVMDAKEALIHALMQTSNVYSTAIINCIAVNWGATIKNYYIVGKVVVGSTTYYKWVTADALPLEYVYTTKWQNLTIYGGDAIYQLVNGTMVLSEKTIFSAHHINTATDMLIKSLQGDNSNATLTAILAAFGNIDFSTLAKEATLGTPSDASTANTIFGRLAAVIAAVGNIDFSALAHETSVKDGNDTAIGMLKDQTNGLAAIKTAIGNITVDTSNLATKNLEQFFNITSSTSYTAATPWEIGNELVDIWHDVIGEWPPSVAIIGASKSVYANGRTQYSDPDEGVLG